MERNIVSQKAKGLLLDGQLLENTETIALKLSHDYDWARRMIQEIALILAGQTIKYLLYLQLERREVLGQASLQKVLAGS